MTLKDDLEFIEPPKIKQPIKEDDIKFLSEKEAKLNNLKSLLIANGTLEIQQHRKKKKRKK